jgi:hypothetical protein
VVSKSVNEYIINSYSRWNDYAQYQAGKAGIPDEAGDILNEVILSLLQKPSSQLKGLLSRKRQSFTHKDQTYTELDYMVLRMIWLNTHSKTSPYRHKTKNVPLDLNISPEDVDITEPPYDDHEINTLERTRKAREILDSLNIPAREKEIFSWKFFADNPLSSWQGPESYTVTCSIFNKVKRKMIDKIKNPHSTRRTWTDREIEYLKAEYPHCETMSIAHYMGRNYNSVRRKAQELKLKKTLFTKRKINLKSGSRTLCNGTTKGEGP